ncbi:MAG: aspartate carbamoyltransferase [Gemmatimonadota bacterium]|nr:aspartate carbamoyltransferase [Gemmatimonadota bacterium]
MQRIGRMVWVSLAIAACGEGEETAQHTPRQAAVAERGTAVMPFDLEATTHVFEKTEYGGLQQVVVDTGDPQQVALVREHLKHEAERFSSGDFHDPAMIHGDDMAGLNELAEGHADLVIEFSELAQGAELRYSSDDPDLVAALHAWFDAQVSDHGRHARTSR